MSKISADTLRAKTLGVEVDMKYPVHGSSKAWANFTGSATVTLNQSLNVTSVTDLGTGDYRLNFTSPFADAFYANEKSDDLNSMGYFILATTTSRNVVYSLAGSLTDTSRVSVAAQGALA